MHGSIENLSFLRNCDIKTTKCEEHHERFYFGLYLKFISKNSDTRTLDQRRLLNSHSIIPEQLISLRKPIHRIPVQCLNKLGKRLFCDRALLTFTETPYTISWKIWKWPKKKTPAN